MKKLIKLNQNIIQEYKELRNMIYKLQKTNQDFFLIRGVIINSLNIVTRKIRLLEKYVSNFVLDIELNPPPSIKKRHTNPINKDGKRIQKTSR